MTAPAVCVQFTENDKVGLGLRWHHRSSFDRQRWWALSQACWGPAGTATVSPMVQICPSPLPLIRLLTVRAAELRGGRPGWVTKSGPCLKEVQWSRLPLLLREAAGRSVPSETECPFATNQSYLCLDLKPPTSSLQPPALREISFCSLQTTQSRAFCYSSGVD